MQAPNYNSQVALRKRLQEAEVTGEETWLPCLRLWVVSGLLAVGRRPCWLAGESGVGGALHKPGVRVATWPELPGVGGARRGN